ncbi:MAG: hypothetical protein ACYC6N_16110 [Pirellulaceae bacterium]
MSTSVSADVLAAQLALAELLRTGRDRMLDPQDLPGRYGRVIRSLDLVLQAIHGSAVVAGGWAVWRHGYLGRVTQDVDIVVPIENVGPLLEVAAVSGFEVCTVRPGARPKLCHKETGVEVDILPEDARPGTPSRPAPTTIPHPAKFGAEEGRLRYIDLLGLIELKLAAGRARDESDVKERLAQTGPRGPANPASRSPLRRSDYRFSGSKYFLTNSTVA